VVHNYKTVTQDGGGHHFVFLHKTQQLSLRLKYIYEILHECSQPLPKIGHMTKIDTGSKFKMAAAVI